MPTLATNKKALSSYRLLEKFEAGLILSGPEVKSAKSGHLDLKNSYVSLDAKNEPWLIGCHIAAYKPAAAIQASYIPTRSRKLLLKSQEILSLIGKIRQKGLTIVPISVYTKGSFIKVEIALAVGKKQFDKRETIKKRDIDREIRRRIRGKY